MATAEERMATEFMNLLGVASQLAETWINGNKTDVYLAIESAPYRDAPALALLVSSYVDDDKGTHYAATSLARALHERGWNG